MSDALIGQIPKGLDDMARRLEKHETPSLSKPR